jgi:outer membrane protein
MGIKFFNFCLIVVFYDSFTFTANNLKSVIMNLKQSIVFLFCAFAIQFSQAQSILKIGHVNIQEIVQKHPSADSLRKVLDSETKEMENLYNEMIVEHDSKLGVFEKEKAGYSEFVRNSKEKELIEMAQKI